MEQEIMYKNWCTVKLDNLVHNYLYTKQTTGKRVICVVKADAYGHGAIKAAKALMKAGCDFFAVSSYEEAFQLRQGGIDCGIVILGRIMPHEISLAAKQNISFAAGSLEFVEEVLNTAKGVFKAKIHIKLNTGMNRTGFDAIHEGVTDGFDKALKIIVDNPDCFEVEGVFSHFAKAEDDEGFTRGQYQRYLKAVDYIEGFGISPKIRHIANSAGSVKFDDMSLDATRLGIYLYGCESDDKNYLPVMSFNARILEIKKLQKGDGVSYGLDFVAKKDTTIAVVGMGYADGVHRCLSDGKGSFLYKGRLCPIIGRVCMDMTMIDVTDIDNPKTLDTVTFFGENDGSLLPCSLQAHNASTISYELLCSVSKRVPRVYL